MAGWKTDVACTATPTLGGGRERTSRCGARHSTRRVACRDLVARSVVACACSRMPIPSAPRSLDAWRRDRVLAPPRAWAERWGGGRSAVARRPAMAAPARDQFRRHVDPRWPHRHWATTAGCGGRRGWGRRAAAGVHRCPRPSRLDALGPAIPAAHRGGRAVVRSQRPGSRAAVTDDAVGGLAPGARADLVVVAADTVTAAVMDHPPRTLVIRAGDVIASAGELCSTTPSRRPFHQR